jgi:hypothetical protein
VAVSKHGRPIVVVMAVEEHERLKVFKIGQVQCPPKHDQEDGMTDQAIHNKNFIRSIKTNLGSRSHFTPGSRPHSADPKKSEFPQWR